jgi:pimeloyl-ACP methyl ester carboxylesterase
MATFVLVHGAWVGGFYWKKVTPLLQTAGHAVYTPTLTGIGERAHLLARTIDLDLHIQDVVNVLNYEDLHEVVLVGHSYGGMVITGVLERSPERLAQVIYLDAFVPVDGEALLDLATPERVAWIREQVAAAGYGWLIPCPPFGTFGLAGPHAAWLAPLAGPQPLTTFEQPVRLSNHAAQAVPHTFIRCSESPGFKSQGERAQAATGWRYYELPTSHFAMVTMPQQLADLLIAVAASTDSAGRR